MKLSSGKNTNIILLLLVAALLFAVYYYILLPKLNELDRLQYSVSSLEGEISNLQEQSQLSGQVEDTNKNLFAIRKKLPQSRELDQLLLNLEEIEYITDSRILSIDFNSYDELVSDSKMVENSEETQVTVETNETSDGKTVEPEENTPTSSIAAELLPSDLKLITFSIEVESPNSLNLEGFIKEIENLERIMHIDTIYYSLPGEENDFIEDPEESVFATIQVTTFYYEGEK